LGKVNDSKNKTEGSMHRMENIPIPKMYEYNPTHKRDVGTSPGIVEITS
jgi:hypothetical protein